MTQPIPPAPKKEKKLLEQCRDIINLKHYSPRTGDTYILCEKMIHLTGLNMGLCRHCACSDQLPWPGKGSIKTCQVFVVAPR